MLSQAFSCDIPTLPPTILLCLTVFTGTALVSGFESGFDFGVGALLKPASRLRLLALETRASGFWFCPRRKRIYNGLIYQSRRSPVDIPTHHQLFRFVLRSSQAQLILILLAPAHCSNQLHAAPVVARPKWGLVIPHHVFCEPTFFLPLRLHILPHSIESCEQLRYEA